MVRGRVGISRVHCKPQGIPRCLRCHKLLVNIDFFFKVQAYLSRFLSSPRLTPGVASHARACSHGGPGLFEAVGPPARTLPASTGHWTAATEAVTVCYKTGPAQRAALEGAAREVGSTFLVLGSRVPFISQGAGVVRGQGTVQKGSPTSAGGQKQKRIQGTSSEGEQITSPLQRFEPAVHRKPVFCTMKSLCTSCRKILFYLKLFFLLFYYIRDSCLERHFP